jgi:hypothetical protein
MQHTPRLGQKLAVPISSPRAPSDPVSVSVHRYEAMRSDPAGGGTDGGNIGEREATTSGIRGDRPSLVSAMT